MFLVYILDLKINADESDAISKTQRPLTNLALAVKLDPTMPSKLKSLTIMGGNMNGVGNVPGLVGEFNFYGDPEGAKITLDEYIPQVSIWFLIEPSKLTLHNCSW